MKKTMLVSAAMLLAMPVFAQPVPTMLGNPTNPEAQAPRPDRAHGIPTQLAIEAANSANATCKANNNITTTVVVDSEGTPIVVISDDGAKAITQRIAQGKAMIALKTKGPSADGAKADAAIMASLGTPRAGGLPLMAGANVVGAIAVSGSPTGQADEVCAKAAIAKIADRIK